jgi:hypothetical protein
VGAVPNRDQAIIDPVKISGYLLSETHPVGLSKARFFKRFGFRADAPDELSRALLDHLQDCPVEAIEVSPYGTNVEWRAACCRRMAAIPSWPRSGLFPTAR